MTQSASTELAAGGGDVRAAIIDARAIAKQYGPTRALAGADLQVSEGEIVGVVGHNGAGKSTLMRVLTGLTSPDAGSVILHGQDVTADYSLARARAAGIRIAFQELSLCPELRVFENLLVAHGGLGGMRWRREAALLIQEQLNAIFPGHGISPRAHVRRLTLAQRQMLEIAQATVELDRPVHLLILDEPTAALGEESARGLFRFLHRQRERGVSCILISHRLPDILQHTDRAVVMRDGQIVDGRPSTELTRNTLVELMGGDTGSSVPDADRLPDPGSSDWVLDVDDLTARGLHHVSLRVTAGEIVGLAGLAGQGQHELLQELWRQRSPRRTSGHASVRTRAPLAYVTGDRQVAGVFPLWSVTRNLSVASLHSLGRFGTLSVSTEVQLARSWISRLGIKARLESLVTSLSGGSQQKVLVARALASPAHVVLLDDPFRGVDVATKLQLYGIMREEARRGRSFVWYTSENEELIECDRAYVFHGGAVVQTLQGAEIREDRIIAASFQHEVQAR